MDLKPNGWALASDRFVEDEQTNENNAWVVRSYGYSHQWMVVLVEQVFKGPSNSFLADVAN
jgi:hypothetical protein